MKATEKKKEYMKRYNKTHKEKIKVAQKKYYENHKEYFKQFNRSNYKELQQKIEKAVEYCNSCINKDLDLETLDEPYKTTFKTAYEIHNNYLDILNGSDE